MLEASNIESLACLAAFQFYSDQVSPLSALACAGLKTRRRP